jgi:hypothetical protein
VLLPVEDASAMCSSKTELQSDRSKAFYCEHASNIDIHDKTLKSIKKQKSSKNLAMLYNVEGLLLCASSNFQVFALGYHHWDSDPPMRRRNYKHYSDMYYILQNQLLNLPSCHDLVNVPL